MKEGPWQADKCFPSAQGQRGHPIFYSPSSEGVVRGGALFYAALWRSRRHLGVAAAAADVGPFWRALAGRAYRARRIHSAVWIVVCPFAAMIYRRWGSTGSQTWPGWSGHISLSWSALNWRFITIVCPAIPLAPALSSGFSLFGPHWSRTLATPLTCRPPLAAPPPGRRWWFIGSHLASLPSLSSLPQALPPPFFEGLLTCMKSSNHLKTTIHVPIPLTLCSFHQWTSRLQDCTCTNSSPLSI